MGVHAEKHVDRIQGGTLQLGDHLIAAWSRLQPRIALSSGEAELYAGMRGISETLGFVHLMCEFKSNDWGRIVHRVDASACRAIMLRRGCGGLKNITVKSLWVQEAAVTMPRSIDWGSDACWPVLDHAQLLTGVVNRIEFPVLLFVHWSLLPTQHQQVVRSTRLVRE